MTDKKRLLVIDDEATRIEASFCTFGSRARNILATKDNTEEEKKYAEKMALDYKSEKGIQVSVESGGEKEISKALTNEQYKAILLDGNLHLGLGKPSDGAVIAQKIKEGSYGTINQQTEIYSTSSSITAIPSCGDNRFSFAFPDEGLIKKFLQD